MLKKNLIIYILLTLFSCSTVSAGPVNWDSAEKYITIQQKQFCDLKNNHVVNLYKAINSRNEIKINRIKKKVFNFKKKHNIENQILSFLKEHEIKMIFLAGFMKILSRNFIAKFRGKILNIHPSLLPKYKGLNTHQRALNNNEKYSGCTVHFVNSRLDSGKIILQKKVKISKNETKDSLTKKVLVQEHKLYPKAILKAFNL